MIPSREGRIRHAPSPFFFCGSGGEKIIRLEARRLRVGTSSVSQATSTARGCSSRAERETKKRPAP